MRPCCGLWGLRLRSRGARARSGDRTIIDFSTVQAKHPYPGVETRRIDFVQFTVVEYRFRPEAVFPVHHHSEEQVVIVLEGSVRFGVDGRPMDLGPGACGRVAPNIPHGATAGPQGARMMILVSPRRREEGGPAVSTR
jgi:quercetin dioxygenase-like cupin family protein